LTIFGWCFAVIPLTLNVDAQARHGITFAQDESSALFYGMPNSAIRTGCVDFILSPGDIALELTRLRGFEGYINRKSFKINPSA